MPTSQLHRRLIYVLGRVPKGSVASYGQIARLAGYPGMARQVVWTLHSSSRKHKLPWHRIVNSQGRIGPMDERWRLKQRALLRKEGVEFDLRERIDLARFGWAPDRAKLRARLRAIS